MNKEPKILIWDIETSLMVAALFSPYNTYITHEKLLKDWEILGGAYKWLGESKVYTVYGKSEKQIVKQLAKAVSQADIVIGHNQDKFDIKRLKTRMLKHGLKPLDKVISIDTLKVAKKEFNFTYNRLDYLGAFLGVGRKLKSKEDLWLEILNGNKKALARMEKYNIQDVVLLEKVYLKLRPHISNHPNVGLFTDTDELVCPNCGSEHLQKFGFKYLTTGKYQRYICKDCGKNSRGRVKLKGVDVQ